MSAPVLRAALVQEHAHALLRPPSRQLAVAPADEAGRLADHAALTAQALQLEQLRSDAYAAGLEAGRAAAFDDGQRAGLTEGRTQGRAAALREYGERIARVDAMLAQLECLQRRSQGAAEDDIVALAFACACRLVGDAAICPQGARQIVMAALAQLRTRPLLVVRVHPDDLDALRGDTAIGALIAGHGAGASLQWLADTKVELGGCIFETPDGTLDARLETQMHSLRETLLAARMAAANGATP